MNARINAILDRIKALEIELEDAVHTQETQLLYRVRDKKIEFEKNVRETHRALRVGLLRWLAESPPRHVLSVPIIYSMIVPLAFLDFSISLYQWLCFPLYRIGRVRRADYVVVGDRRQLQYLNVIEKINCEYCAYANGVIAYTREIVARTEQYWCPIKHARKVLHSHSRYATFIDYGAGEGLNEKIDRIRSELAAETVREKA